MWILDRKKIAELCGGIGHDLIPEDTGFPSGYLRAQKVPGSLPPT